MGKLTLLTLLRLLVNKKVISVKEAEDISYVEQVSDILKNKGVCEDTDFIEINTEYNRIIKLCRGVISSPKSKTRGDSRKKLQQILRKERTFA